MKYEVIEYRSTADTYQVEASSEEEAEHLVSEGKGELVRNWEEHDFYEVIEDMEESRENLEGLVQRLTIQNDALEEVK
jgi:hypothetical protein|tara:strand:- start:1957 stop:2190 length:234 start_codon:yes stop_codon:yes gene_type:complete